MDAFTYLAIAYWCVLLGYLFCLLAFVVQTFLNGEGDMGAACLVLTCCCGIGTLMTMYYGWSKAEEWENGPLMISLTLFLVLALILKFILRSAGQPWLAGL